jgi:hypothetical protein
MKGWKFMNDRSSKDLKKTQKLTEENLRDVNGKAFEQGMFVKVSKRRYGKFKEWDLHGRPQMIVVDNRSNLESLNFRPIVEHVMGVELKYRDSSFGGTIERLFETFTTELSDQIYGARKSTEELE